MPTLLKRTLVILLALRAIAAPVVLRPSTPTPSQGQCFVIRMRSWPHQRLQRFSATSKLLQLRVGKNRATFVEGCRLLTFCPLRPASCPHVAAPVPGTPENSAMNRLAVCLRC